MQQYAPRPFFAKPGLPPVSSGPNYSSVYSQEPPPSDCWLPPVPFSTEEFLFPSSSAAFSQRDNAPFYDEVPASAPSWPPVHSSRPTWNAPVHDPRQRWVPPSTAPLTVNTQPIQHNQDNYYEDAQEEQYQQYLRAQEEREHAQRQRELLLKASPPPKAARVPTPPLVNSQFGEFILTEVTCPPKQEAVKEKSIHHGKEIIPHAPVEKAGFGQNFCDITEYLNMPQTQAAKLLGVPTSTLSKRWKESCPNRKWPWRTINKLDKSIATILQEVNPGEDIPSSQKTKLALLLRQRQEELLPAVIRL